MKRFLTLLSLLLLATILSQAQLLALCYTPPHLATSLPRINATRTLYIVAVTQLPNGTYVGTYARLTVHVLCPGSGHVYLETMPLTQIDTQASARIAALVASMVAGIPFNYCNYYASIQSNTTIVGGPSASLAMTVAFAAALLGLKLNHSVVMTGMIMPDGSVGPVGGLYYKLYAAKAAGAKIFLIPYGQINVTVTKVVRRQIGPAIIIRSYPVTINLAELGKRIGVKVIQVATVFQALKYATNGAFNYTVNIKALRENLQALRDRMHPIVIKWIEAESTQINETLRHVQKLIRLINASSLIAELVRKYVGEYLNASYYYYREGLALRNSSPYAAASMLFASLVYAKRALYLAKFFVDPRSINSTLSSLKNSILSYLANVRKEYQRTRYMSLNKLSIYIDVLERIYDALTSIGRALRIAKHVTTLSDLLHLVDDTAYADARLLSAKLWSLALEATSGGIGGGIEISRDLLLRDAQTIEAYARNTIAYVVALSSQLSSSPSQPLELATKLLDMATESRDPLTKLTLSIDALSNAYVALVTLFQIPSLPQTLNKTITVLLGQLTKLHALPPDIAMYLELSRYQYRKTLLLSRISIRLSSLLDLALQTLRPLPPHAVASTLTYATPKTVTITKIVTVTQTQVETKTVTSVHTITVTYSVTSASFESVLPYIIAIAVILSCSVAAILVVIYRQRLR